MKMHLAYKSGPFEPAAWSELDLPWPSVPPVGAVLYHCGGWAGESIAYVGWALDGTVEMECKVSADVVQHMIAEHGFTSTR